MTEPKPSNHKTVNRRDFLKISAMAGGILAGGGLLRAFLYPEPAVVSDSRLLMGTVINLTLVAENEKQGWDAIAAAFDAMGKLTSVFNFRETSSELYLLNQAGRLDQPSPELIDILEKAKYFGDISDGAFDITVLPVLDAYRAGQPVTNVQLALVDYRKILVQNDRVQFENAGMQVTLDGIAKGRVVDGGVSALAAIGFKNILVEAGGDLLASGAHPDGDSWKIAIAHPRPSGENKWLTSFRARNQAVATSGDYLNAFTPDFSQNHIVDPRSGLSPVELASATVIAPSVTEADALSTTMMVLGVKKGLALVERLPGVETLLVKKDLTIYRSPGFPTS
jgi:thiamine biosynthesis lipoprotein